MKKTIIALTTVSSISLSAYGANHLVYMGGGGEPPGTQTMFDDHIKSMKKVTSTGKWSYQTAFNGGHSKTEALIKESFPNPVTPPTHFTRADYNKTIEDLKQKVTNGSLKKGDQLIVMIDTHGAQGDPKDEITHKVSLSSPAGITNFNTLAGTTTQLLDNLKELVTLTESRGIKLGIVDLSCHAGSTLNLAKNQPNTCVVAASGPKHFSYTGNGAFTNLFVNNLGTKDTSLEDAFLKARLDSDDSAFPMISTANNDKASAEFYELIGPYLNSQYNVQTGKLHDDILAMNNPQNKCMRQEQFSNLINKLNSLQNLSDKAFKDRANLIVDLKAYHELQMKMHAESLRVGTATLQNKVSYKSAEINPLTGKHYYNINITWEELIKIDKTYFKNISYQNIEKYKNEADYPNRVKALEKALSFVNNKIDEITAQNPSLRQSMSKSLNYAVNLANTFNISEKIGQKEKRIYDTIYNSSAKNPNNPCQQIKI